jgi:2,6-dihydroxypseudooxynicotine hydrolase
MADATLAYLWENITDRFLAEGAVYRELRDLRRRIDRLEEWPAAWAETARATAQRADRLLASGAAQSAAADYWRTSIYYFFSQFLLWDSIETKSTLYAECVRSFRAASMHFDVPQQPIEIPFRGITMPGYLRVPPNVDRPPVVLLLNGLDTTKEEQLVISNLCIQRGLATVSFDGPGSGETLYRMNTMPDYVDAVHAAIDFVERRPEIDPHRIGVIGRSLGSHYAARAAMRDHRIKGVVSWGSMYDMKNYRSIPPLTLAGFVFVCGAKTLQDAKPYLDSIDLAHVHGRIRCPLMVVNGGRDPITPPDNIDRMRALGRGVVEVMYWEDSSHCMHDRPHICRPAMADFVARHLGA